MTGAHSTVVKALVGFLRLSGAAVDAEAANASDETAFSARFAAEAQNLFKKRIEDLTDEERAQVVRALTDERNERRE